MAASVAKRTCPVEVGAHGRMGAGFRGSGVTGLEPLESPSHSIRHPIPDDHPRSRCMRGQTVQLRGHRQEDGGATVAGTRWGLLCESMGVKEGGLPAFREEVIGNMQREMEDRIQRLIVTQVMDQLASSAQRSSCRPPWWTGGSSARKEAIAQPVCAPRLAAAWMHRRCRTISFRGTGGKRAGTVGLVDAPDSAMPMNLQGWMTKPIRAEVERIAQPYAEPEAVVSRHLSGRKPTEPQWKSEWRSSRWSPWSWNRPR